MGSVKLLLDTHTFIWAMRDPQRLGPRAASAIVDAENVVLVSAVVGWEVSTKHRIGKLPNGQAILGSFGDAIDDLRADELPISVAHGLAAGGFGSAHRDPFDRLLAAQAMVEGAALVTLDPAFADFPVTTLW